MDIAISGKMGSGKTSTSNYLAKKYGFTSFSFANKIKELEAIQANTPQYSWRGHVFPIVYELIHYLIESDPDNYLSDSTTKESMLISATDIILMEFEKHEQMPGTKNRKLLQDLGNGLRTFLDFDVWVSYTLHSYRYKSCRATIIDDLRYRNELDACIKNGCVTIRLEVSPEIQKERLLRIYGLDYLDDPSILTHISEVDLDDRLQEFDFILDANGTEDYLFQQVNSIMERLKEVTRQQ
jgi:hypothetical protein